MLVPKFRSRALGRDGAALARAIAAADTYTRQPALSRSLLPTPPNFFNPSDIVGTALRGIFGDSSGDAEAGAAGADAYYNQALSTIESQGQGGVTGGRITGSARIPRNGTAPVREQDPYQLGLQILTALDQQASPSGLEDAAGAALEAQARAALAQAYGESGGGEVAVDGGSVPLPSEATFNPQSFEDFTSYLGAPPSYPTDQVLALNDQILAEQLSQNAGLEGYARSSILGAEQLAQQNQAQIDQMIGSIGAPAQTLSTLGPTGDLTNLGAVVLAQGGVRDHAAADAIGAELMAGNQAKVVEQAAASYNQLANDMNAITQFQTQALGDARANATVGGLQALAMQRFAADSDARISSAEAARDIAMRGLEQDYNTQTSLFDAYANYKLGRENRLADEAFALRKEEKAVSEEALGSLAEQAQLDASWANEMAKRTESAWSDQPSLTQATDLYVVQAVSQLISGDTNWPTVLADLQDYDGSLTDTAEQMISDIERLTGMKRDGEVIRDIGILADPAVSQWISTQGRLSTTPEDYAGLIVNGEQVVPLNVSLGSGVAATSTGSQSSGNGK